MPLRRILAFSLSLLAVRLLSARNSFRGTALEKPQRLPSRHPAPHPKVRPAGGFFALGVSVAFVAAGAWLLAAPSGSSETERSATSMRFVAAMPELPLPDARSRRDVSPPASQILQPADGSHVQAGQPVDVAVEADDPDGRVSEVDVSLDGGLTWQVARPDNAPGSRIWRVAARGLAAGSHRLLARAVDQSGNVGTTLRPVSLSIDAADGVTIRNPYGVPGSYRLAQLHDHTANSFDGDKRFSPDVKSWYLKEAGYNVVIYTDHDKISESSAHSDGNFQVFPGYESTGASGHISAWFTRQVIDHRLPAQQRIDAIRRAGGIAGLNHPEWSTGYSVEGLQQLSGYRTLEIYNWLTTKNEALLASTLEKWRQVLNAKGPQEPVWGIAVGDAHGPQFSTAWTVLKVTDLSEASIRAAIENGAMFGSNGPGFETIETEGERVRVRATNARFIRFLDDSGAMVLDVQGSAAEYRVSKTQRWVRIEASDGAGHTAWSQPLWIIPTPPKVAGSGTSADAY
jgi:hypothetical protein